MVAAVVSEAPRLVVKAAQDLGLGDVIREGMSIIRIDHSHTYGPQCLDDLFHPNAFSATAYHITVWVARHRLIKWMTEPNGKTWYVRDSVNPVEISYLAGDMVRVWEDVPFDESLVGCD